MVQSTEGSDCSPSEFNCQEFNSSPPPRPLSRWRSFGSFGSVEAVEALTLTGLHRSKSSVSVLSVVEPVTPMGKGATDSPKFAGVRRISRPISIGCGLGFDFDALEEEESPNPLRTKCEQKSFGHGLGFDFDALDALDGNENISALNSGCGNQDNGSAQCNVSGFDYDSLVSGGVNEAADPQDIPNKVPLKRFATSALDQIRCPSAENSNSEDEAVPTKRAVRRVLSTPAQVNLSGFKVAMISNGSRGDVQPVVALALSLKSMGHSVKIFTNANLVDFCFQRGIEAVAVFADCQAVIESLGGMGGESYTPLAESLQRGRKAAEDWLRKNPGVCTAAYDALENFTPDVVACGSQATGPAMRYETNTGVPVIYTFFSRAILDVSMGFTQLCPPRPSLYAVCQALDNLGQRPAVDGLCGQVGLMQTGDWILPETQEEAMLNASSHLSLLPAFINDGPSPVVIGWGSMIAEGLPQAQMLAIALRALKLAHRRGVILGGWARLHELGFRLLEKRYLRGVKDAVELADFAEKNVFFVEEAPHSWLFPRCYCVVHHGGAGTAQAALRAGVPSIVTPIFGDQYGHGAALVGACAGSAFDKPLTRITAAELAEAIKRSASCSVGARKASKHICQEDGARRAAAAIDTFLWRRVFTGEFARQQAERREEKKMNEFRRGQRNPNPVK